MQILTKLPPKKRQRVQPTLFVFLRSGFKKKHCVTRSKGNRPPFVANPPIFLSLVAIYNYTIYICMYYSFRSSQCFKNSMVYCNICYLIKVLLYAKCLKTDCLYFVVQQSTILVILHIHVICIPCVHCTLPYSVLCTM